MKLKTLKDLNLGWEGYEPEDENIIECLKREVKTESLIKLKKSAAKPVIPRTKAAEVIVLERWLKILLKTIILSVKYDDDS